MILKNFADEWDGTSLFVCSVEAAVNVFAQMRPPGIYKQDYLDELFVRYGDREDTPAAPPLPDWCLGMLIVSIFVPLLMVYTFFVYTDCSRLGCLTCTVICSSYAVAASIALQLFESCGLKHCWTAFLEWGVYVLAITDIVCIVILFSWSHRTGFKLDVFRKRR